MQTEVFTEKLTDEERIVLCQKQAVKVFKSWLNVYKIR